jgi:hypothetical protein
MKNMVALAVIVATTTLTSCYYGVMPSQSYGGYGYNPYSQYENQNQSIREGVRFLKEATSEQNCPREYPSCYARDFRLEVQTTERGNTFSGEGGVYAPGGKIRESGKPTQHLGRIPNTTTDPRFPNGVQK